MARAKLVMPVSDPKYVAERLFQLDRDGIDIMLNTPENFPAFLVIRLCEIAPINAKVGRGSPTTAYRPPLAELVGGVYRLNKLGKAVARAYRQLAQESSDASQ